MHSWAKMDHSIDHWMFGFLYISSGWVENQRISFHFLFEIKSNQTERIKSNEMKFLITLDLQASGFVGNKMANESIDKWTGRTARASRARS